VVLLVVPAGHLSLDRAQVHGDDAKALALEAGDDLAGEAPLDSVGLDDDEGAISHTVGGR
jgi:hypothetical protein